MIVESVRVHIINYQRFVMLKQKNSNRFLPIRVGEAEAQQIANRIDDFSQVKTHLKVGALAVMDSKTEPVERPSTHDFACTLASFCGGTIKSVVINRVKDNTFFAQTNVELGSEEFIIDCRPSDAIAVALTVGVPIFASCQVLDSAGIIFEENVDKGQQKETELKSGSLFNTLFSEYTQGVLDYAEQIAKSLKHDYFTTGHLLLALVERAIPQFMTGLGVNDINAFRSSILDSLNSSYKDEGSTSGLSSISKKVIKASIQEAKNLNSIKTRPEHLLLAMVRQNEGLAQAILKSYAVTPEKIFEGLLRIYSNANYSAFKLAEWEEPDSIENNTKSYDLKRSHEYDSQCMCNDCLEEFTRRRDAKP